jgi:hypothetical protein
MAVVLKFIRTKSTTQQHLMVVPKRTAENSLKLLKVRLLLTKSSSCITPFNIEAGAGLET